MGRSAAARREGGKLVSSLPLLVLAAAGAAPLAAVAALGAGADLPAVMRSTLAEPRFLKALGFTLWQALASTAAAIIG